MDKRQAKILQQEQPEITLLLQCARVQASASSQEQINTLLLGKVDWAYLLEMARRNCVLPLLYLNLKTAASDAAPQQVLAALERVYQRTAFDNLFLTRQLIHLMRCLDCAGIPVIAYKGSVLTQSIYTNLALRQFGDLDIIVREADVNKARAVLFELGFSQEWPERELSDWEEDLHRQQKYNYTFCRVQDRVVVELHWNIVPRYLRIPWEPQWLWRRLDSFVLADQKILTFPPEELLLTLCIHGANHCWNRLHWVCDIAELTKRSDTLNWDSVLSLAQTWRAERILHLGLALAGELLDANLPKEVKRRIAMDSGALMLAGQSCRWLFARQWLYFRPFEEPLYHLRMRDQWRERVYYCGQMLVPSSADRAFVSLPRSLSFLYYLIRPFQLLTRHGIYLLKK
jgi:hypothetical protein